MHAWFLEIAFVQEAGVCMCVYVCMRVCVCVCMCMCVSSPFKAVIK